MKLTKTLTEAEQARLEACEERIQSGMESFLDVAEALVEIRDSKLYRETHGTFGEYCIEVWSMSRQRAYQLIDAGKVAKALPEECQARLTIRTAEALAKAEPQDRENILKAAGGTKATGASVKAEIAKRTPAPEPTPEPPHIRTADEELKEMAAKLNPAFEEQESAPAPARARFQYGDRVRQLIDEIKESPASVEQLSDVRLALQESIRVIEAEIRTLRSL